MSDQTPQTVTPQAGQPAPVAQSQEHLTQADLEKVGNYVFGRFESYFNTRLPAANAPTPAPAAGGTVTPAPATQPAQAAQPPAPVAQAARYADVNKQVEQLSKTAGMDILEDDPEAAALIKAKSEPEFLDMYQQAIQAKRQRLNPPTQLPTNLLTGSPSPVKTLKEQYDLEMSQAKPGSEQAMQVRRKYRAKGLDL